MAIDVASTFEKSLADTEFEHGRSFEVYMSLALLAMYENLRDPGTQPFNLVTIYTAANRRSVMSKIKYHAF